MDKHTFIKETARSSEKISEIQNALKEAFFEHGQAYILYDAFFGELKEDDGHHHFHISSSFETLDNAMAWSNTDRTSELFRILSDKNCRKVLVEIIYNYIDMPIYEDTASEIAEICEIEPKKAWEYIQSMGEIGMLLKHQVNGKECLLLQTTKIAGYELLMAGVIGLFSKCKIQ